MNSMKRSEGIGIYTAITFAVGTMVGAGVFVLSGLVVATVGPGAFLSYIICAILVAFSGLSYATLASICPEDGGGYLYSERMLGRFPGFLAGWIMYIAQPIVISFVLLGFGIYLNLLLSATIDPRIFALLALLLISILNIRGIAEAGKFEVLIVVSKVVILILLSIAGVVFFQPMVLSPFLPSGAESILQGITMVFFAYMGFQVITMMAGEVKQSSKSVPIAMLGSIVIVLVIYCGVILALLSANLTEYGAESLFDAAQVLMGPIGSTIIAIGAVLSTLSSANALTSGASRIVMEMAVEKQIPGRFATLRNGQPTNAVLLGAIVSAAFIIFGNLEMILGLVNMAMLIAMLFVNASAIVLTRDTSRVEEEKNYFRLPFGPVIPILGAITCIAITITIDPFSIALGIIALLGGLIFYFIEDTPEGEQEVEKIRSYLANLREHNITVDK